MLQQIMNQSAWAFLLEAAVLIGVLSKIIAIVHYNRLMNETQQMNRLHTKWIKALKKRFDNYEQLQFQVHYPESFVDKYMEMDRICGIKSRVFLRIPFVSSLLILLCAFQGREDWIFMTGINLIIAFMIEELLIDEKNTMRMIKTNLMLSMEKGNIKKRKNTAVKTKQEDKKVRREAAVAEEEKELLSQEEVDTFGQIMKEWWEF